MKIIVSLKYGEKKKTDIEKWNKKRIEKSKKQKKL
jgi:hypothetical protein